MRSAFDRPAALGEVLAKLLRVVLCSCAELGEQALASLAKEFVGSLHVHNSQGSGRKLASGKLQSTPMPDGHVAAQSHWDSACSELKRRRHVWKRGLLKKSSGLEGALQVAVSTGHYIKKSSFQVHKGCRVLTAQLCTQKDLLLKWLLTHATAILDVLRASCPYSVFLSCGSLLAYRRHPCRTVSSDDDVDFTCVVPSTQVLQEVVGKVRDLRKEYKAKGIDLLFLPLSHKGKQCNIKLCVYVSQHVACPPRVRQSSARIWARLSSVKSLSRFHCTSLLAAAAASAAKSELPTLSPQCIDFNICVGEVRGHSISWQELPFYSPPTHRLKTFELRTSQLDGITMQAFLGEQVPVLPSHALCAWARTAYGEGWQQPLSPESFSIDVSKHRFSAETQRLIFG